MLIERIHENNARGSIKLQCHGCFTTLSMTFPNAFCIKTIFEMAPSNYLSARAAMRRCNQRKPLSIP